MMQAFSPDNLPLSYREFAESILEKSPVAVHSLYVVGSILTPDYVPGRSDINTLIVLEKVERTFLDFLVSLGQDCRRDRIAPPLVMTPRYIERSVDVFPIEFFNFQRLHHTLYGEDLLADLTIVRADLRAQCEREIRSRLLWLGQMYLEALDDMDRVLRQMCGAMKGYLPLLRGVLHLTGQEVPVAARDVLTGFRKFSGLDMTVFERLYDMRSAQRPPDDAEEIRHLFDLHLQAVGRLAEVVDALPH